MGRSIKVEPLNWDSVETVLLDMDGTLLDLAFDNYFWLELIPIVYAEKNKLTKANAKSNLDKLYQCYQGTLDWYCTDFWSRKLGLDIVDIKSKVAEKVSYRKGTLEFLQTAQQQNKKLYLVTNAHPDTLAIKLQAKDFSEYFEELITSHQTGYPKEDIRFWQNIEQLWKFDKATTLFVDDSEAILRKAKQFGIAHVLGVTDPDSTKLTQSFDGILGINQLDEILRL